MGSGARDAESHLASVLLGPAVGHFDIDLSSSSDWVRSLSLALAQIAPLCELGPAAKAGLLKFGEPRIFDYFASINAIHGVLEGGSGGLPIVDDWMALNAYSAQPSPRLAEGYAAHALLESVSAFPDAPVDVLLDVRNRISPARVRFRSAVVQLAEELDGLQVTDYERKLDDLHRRIVAPARLEIDESLRELDAIPSLLRMASSPVTVASGSASFLALAAGTLNPDPLFAGLTSAPAIAAAAREVMERRRVKRVARRSPYWLLHEVEGAFGPRATEAGHPGPLWIP